MMKMETPKYEHNCDRCVYLGTYDNKGEGVITTDLYYHNHHSFATVIERYSSEKSDYCSGLYSVGACEGLREAYNRAVEMGLVSEAIKKIVERYLKG
jgi:hypothetical protein